MATQMDIAKLAGVDRTSVSKILCGAQLEHYSDDIVDKVKKAATQLGYKHRNFKNALNIVYVLPMGEDKAFNRYTCAERNMAALLGINKCISGSKHRLQIVNIDYTGNTFDYEHVANSGDVFVVWELSWEWTHDFFDILRKKNKDYVVINRVTDCFKGSYIVHEPDAVYINNVVDLLYKNGHTKIAGVYGDVDMTNRLSAMKDAFKEKRLPFSNDCVFSFKERDVEGCREAAKLIAERGFTAVFVQSNDMNALDLIIELTRLGKRVPDDISIIGNHKRKSLPSIGLDLTSYETPWFEMGKRAAEFLIAGAARSSNSTSIIQEVLKQTFYEGNTITRI